MMRLIRSYMPESIKRKIKSSFINKIYLRRNMLGKFPHAINIELTNRCNLRCRMCPRPRMKNLDVGDMDFELFKKIVDDVAEFANEKTSFTLVGLGEPLMYDKLFDAIEYVKIKCPQSPVIIDSNGTLLDEERSNMLVRALSGGDRLLVSLNAGTRSTYEWLMGADRYDLVSNNIRNFLEMREKFGGKPKIVIQILETKKTNPEVKEFKEYWSSLIGPNDDIYVRPLLNWGGKIDYNALCVREKGERYPCYALWVVIAIDKDGNIYPCCEGFSSRKESGLLFGDVQEKSLIGTYFEKIKEVRQMHLDSRWNDISVCLKCDSWSFCSNIWFKFNRRWF